MNTLTSSPLLAFALIATQLFGPAVLWAADQRGIRIEETRRVVIAGLSGDQSTVQNSEGSKALHFREAVNAGDQIATGDHTVADVLIGNRAVVTLGPGTTAQFTTVSEGQTTIQVKKGVVRVAAASALGEQGIVTVQTPTGQVQMRGGIVRVMVDQQAGAAEHSPTGEARPYRASYSSNPTTVAAALTPDSEIIQVEEGSAEIAGAGGKGVTVQAGQAITLKAGQAGIISTFVNQAGMHAGVLATAGHSQTPKEGRDYLVALQVEQATALGTALTGGAETGKGQSGSKEDTKNVINGATGGVTLVSNSNSGNPNSGNPSPGNPNPAIVNSLFGAGNTANPGSSNPQDRPGAGFGGNNNNGFFTAPASNLSVKVNAGNSLLVFTRKDPVQSVVKETILLVETFSLGGMDFETGNGQVSFDAGTACGATCLSSHRFAGKLDDNVVFNPLAPVASSFSVTKELILIGGTPNEGHGGVAPTETLIIRGAAKETVSSATTFTNRASTVSSFFSADGLYPTDRRPADIGLLEGPPPQITQANSTFVVETSSNLVGGAYVGGTLGQYSHVSTATPNGVAIDDLGSGISHVDGAITATGSNVVLSGGVTLDQGTRATIGTTPATQTYFTNLSSSDTKYSGSLLAVIRGANNTPTALTLQDRLLGVYDGSTINTNGGNKALLSVLDAKLTGPAGSIPLIDIAAGSHFDRAGAVTPGSKPNVTVTSALVTRSTILLDGALLAASAPLFALTKATMTTTSHFADLAGNKAQSMRLGDSLVALNASQLLIENGNLLNLNAATATVNNGYLFSLNNGSTLTLNGGALFSLTNGSSLNLNANAFGVFGSGANVLTIENKLCTATCFQLVNSDNQPFLVNGVTPLNVSGATKNVVLPNDFNVFALAPGATASNADINIDANAALFHIDGTSTLTINGSQVEVR